MSVRYVRASATVIAVTLLSFAGASHAATIALSSGEWTRFTFPGVGQPALDTFTFEASPTGAILYVTDAGLSGDRFSVSVNGGSVGTTSPASRGFSCGFDPRNCYKSSLMSNGNFVLKDGGNQHINITTTASAVSGMGGAGFLRADTSFLNLYGDVGARTDFIRIINGASKGVRFYEDQFDPASSFTQLFADVIDESQFNSFGKLLYQVTSGTSSVTSVPESPVNLLLGYDLSSVWGGAACVTSSLVQDQDLSCLGSPFNFQALDLADIKKLPTGSGLSDTPTSIIAHELAEASGIIYQNGFESAHSDAILKQNLVLKDETGGQRDPNSGSRSLPLGIILNNLYFNGDFKPADALLQGGKLLDYSGSDTLYYKQSNTENWLLFPWIDPTGNKGWSIWVFSSSVSGWTFADLKNGIFESGVPWSGRDVEVTLNSVNFEPASSNSTPVPTPALLPGLVGMGIATLRRRFKQSKNLET